MPTPRFTPLPRGIEIAWFFNDVAGDQLVAEVTAHVVKLALLDPTPVPTVDLNAMALHAFNWWDDNMKPLQSSRVLLDKTTARDVSQAGGEVVERTSGSHATNASEPYPYSVALVSTWRTARVGRSYRGRAYWPAIPRGEGDTANANFVTDDYRVTFRTACDALRTLIAGTGYTQVVRSMVSGGALRPVAVGTAVNEVTVDRRLDNQRRRGRRLG